MKGFTLIFSLLLTCLTFSQEAPQVATSFEIGKVAPLFEGVRMDGNKIALKKLKGDLILLDFWASWCGPCRMENPNVVRIYDQMKGVKFINGKAFRIVSVSLDRQEQPWIAAIEKDKLKWDDHIWDQKGEIASLYKVKFIPTAYLIDGKGKVIASGDQLRGDNLLKTLEKYKK